MAGHDVQERRLARAVRADKADEFAGRDVECDVRDRNEPSESLRDPFYGEQRAHAGLRRGVRAIVTRPHNPVRKSRAKMMTRAAKITSCQPPTSRSHSDVT